MPTIVANMGIKSTLEMGMLTAIPYAVAAVGMMLVGRLERRWHFAVSAALGALGRENCLTVAITVERSSAHADD